MELQEKQGSIGDWEKEEEHVCKELLAGIEQVWGATGLALFFYAFAMKIPSPIYSKIVPRLNQR